MSAKARAAARELKIALDAHLTACEARSGENDPGVQEAYDALREAAQAYDDALFEDHDEVTPFEFADADGDDDEGVDADTAPEALTLLLRRDFDLVDADGLVAAAQAVTLPEQEDKDDEDDVDDIGSAVYALVQAHGLDGFVARAGEVGLEPTGGTMWVLDEVDGDIDDDPFAGVRESRARLRVDEVYP